MNITVSGLFDLEHTLAAEYLCRFRYPWEALPGLKVFLYTLAAALGKDYREYAPGVWAHTSAVIAPTAFLGAPCIIGPETEVRHCAFVRGSALVGANCVVGNSVELKNVILFDRVQTPHYNYVGDSILGYRSHMGAGSITSNVKSDRMPVEVRPAPGLSVDGIRVPDGVTIPEELQKASIPTGLKKFGAMLGDYVEVGCNSVLNPGSVIGRHTNIYPVSCVRGVVPADSIVKTGGVIVRKENR